MSSTNDKIRRLEIPTELAGMRMDKALAKLFPEFSRSSLQKWLKQGMILVDEEIASQRDQTQGGEQVDLQVPEQASIDWEPEAVEVDVLYQDDHLMVLNKPAGLVVHPGAGNHSGTLVNGLIQRDPGLVVMPRAGIVHRLDKDTTGLMVVARTEASRLDLIRQLSARTVSRSYLAVVQGCPVSGGVVDEPIGRDRHDRRRMAIGESGKTAVTHFRVEQRFRSHCLMRCNLETGRTHQIRVHMRHAGYPLVGDPVYGGRGRFPAGSTESLRKTLQSFKRQALHAEKLKFTHPYSGKEQEWVCDLPDDMIALCGALRKDAGNEEGER